MQGDGAEGSGRMDPGAGDPRRAMERCFEVGRTQWPGLALDFRTFERFVARHVPPGGSLEATHAADLYLACACAAGVDGALALLEPLLAGEVARAAASVDPSHAFVADVLQLVRERLLVGAGGEPGKIAGFAGRSSLKSWLCAVAVRCAISQRRPLRERANAPLEMADDRRLVRAGPEFEYLRRRYKGAFEEAVRTAIRRLPASERALLRLNLVEGMSIDKLGALYGVGRSTAARRLAAARHSLLREARRELRERARLTSTELDSIAAEMRSQLDISIAALLGRSAGSTLRDEAAGAGGCPAGSRPRGR